MFATRYSIPRFLYADVRPESRSSRTEGKTMDFLLQQLEEKLNGKLGALKGC